MGCIGKYVLYLRRLLQRLSMAQSKEQEKSDISLLDIYGNQEIRFIGVVSTQNEIGETTKRIITLRTKEGDIISEDEGKDIENEGDLEMHLIHLIDRLWLNVPWESY